MEVAKQFRITVLYSFLIFLQFFLIFAIAHFLLSNVFQEGSFVNFVEEDITPDEGEDSSDDQSYKSWPEHDCWTSAVGSCHYGSDEDSLDGPLEKNNSHSW